jgi:hypothetical protein
MNVTCVFCALLASLSLDAQVFYNATRDAKAQDALTAAKAVTNGQVFDKMLGNLDLLSKASGDRFFNDNERLMRANLANFQTWGDVSKYLTGLNQRLNADLPGDPNAADTQAALNKVKTEATNAQAALKKLQDAAKAKFSGDEATVSLIGSWFARLGDLSDLIKFAGSFGVITSDAPPGLMDAANEAAALATSLGTMYSSFQVALASTPDIVVLQSQIQLLGVNQDHLKQIAAIIMQRETDLDDIRHVLARTSKAYSIIHAANVADSESITTSLATAKAPVLDNMVSLLYNVAALASRDITPKRLASLRLADEERRFSIRSSAVVAASYETLVASGTQRLANYYKGGLKPETLAQIATALATFGLIPTIAVK